MAWETRTDEGSLFANSRKAKDNDADTVGEVRVRCPHCQRDSLWYLNGWRREKKQRKPDGSPSYWYALKIKIKDKLANLAPGGTMPGARQGAGPPNGGADSREQSNVVPMKGPPSARSSGGPPR